MHSRINEATVTLNAVVTTAAWLIGVALIALSFSGAVPSELKASTCVAGLPFIALGAVRWIAQMLCQLERDQRNVFELGRDYERFHDEPALHSVQ